MTNEELDKARAEEARRIFVEEPLDHANVATIAARLAREGWTPPEPVDPDVLAYWDWHKSVNPTGLVSLNVCDAYLAGARMAREQEQERAKVLLAALDDIRQHGAKFEGVRASAAIATYKAGKAAR